MKSEEDKSPWGLILILFGAGILAAFQVGKAPPVLSDIRSELVISLLHAGWLLSIFSFTGLLMGTFTGAVANAVGHRRLMLAGLILQTAGMVFVNIFGNLAGGKLLKMGFARYKLIAFASMIMGISAFAIYFDTPHFMINYTGCLVFSVFGGLIPASVLRGVPLYAPSKDLIATTNGLVVQFGQTGQVIGPPILAYLVAQTGSWSSGSWFLGGVAGLGVILSFFLSRTQPTPGS